jgi:hypothetical protein
MNKALPVTAMAILLLLPLKAPAKERPGAAAVLTLKGGRTVAGELYAVKADEIVIIDAQGQSTAVALTEIKRIQVRKKTGRSIRTGAIIGAATAAGLAFGTIVANSDGTVGSPEAGEIATLSLLVALGGTVGGLAGWVAGGTSGTRTVLIEGLPPESLEKALVKLRKRARVPSLQ